MALTIRSTAPLDGEAILPLASVKAHLKFDADYTDEDASIQAYRDSAIDWIERYTGCSLAPREWTATFDGFADPIELPCRPVIDVAELTYLGIDGAAIVLQPAAFRSIGEIVMPRVGERWPSSSCAMGTVSVRFQAGFAEAKRDAPALVAAVTMLAGHLYRNREAVITGAIATTLPMGVASLCDVYRRVRV